VYLRPLEGVEQRLARHEPSEDVVGVDDDEEDVVDDGEDVFRVDLGYIYTILYISILDGEDVFRVDLG